MDGSIERQIPGYLLIPHDPDLDQQDHLPGVIVARKEVQNAGNNSASSSLAQPTKTCFLYYVIQDSTFGLILSTNRSERSCIVLWFERKENSV